MEIKISFGGGIKVIAEINGNKIVTDQPIIGGGEGTAPSPFDLFLASIGTCTGVNVKLFCDHRNIQTENISLIQKMEIDNTTHHVSSISLEIHLPSDFPEKYKDAIINAADLCAVKQHLQNPPKITITSKIAK